MLLPGAPILGAESPTSGRNDAGDPARGTGKLAGRMSGAQDRRTGRVHYGAGRTAGLEYSEPTQWGAGGWLGARLAVRLAAGCGLCGQRFRPHRALRRCRTHPAVSPGFPTDVWNFRGTLPPRRLRAPRPTRHPARRLRLGDLGSRPGCLGTADSFPAAGTDHRLPAAARSIGRGDSPLGTGRLDASPAVT